MTLREKYSLKGNIILEASKDNTLVGGVGEIKTVFYMLNPTGTIDVSTPAGIQAFKDAMKDVDGFPAAYNKATNSGADMSMMMDAGYDADSKKNAAGLTSYYKGKKETVGASDVILKGEVTGADSNQGDIEVTTPSGTTPWSIKVGKSTAGQQNLGASDVIKLDASLEKVSLIAPIVKEMTGLELDAIKKYKFVTVTKNDDKTTFPKGAKDSVYKIDGNKLSINYQHPKVDQVSTFVGKAFSKALQAAAVTNATIAKKLIDKVIDNAGIGSEKGLNTLICSPSAADKLVADPTDVTTTTSLFPGISKFIEADSPYDKLVVYTADDKNTFVVGFDQGEAGDLALVSVSPKKVDKAGSMYGLGLQGKPVKDFTSSQGADYTKAAAPTPEEEAVAKKVTVETHYSFGALLLEMDDLLEPGEEIQIESDEAGDENDEGSCGDEGATTAQTSSSRSHALEEKYSLKNYLL